jgi:N-ethylmaleimide reductase
MHTGRMGHYANLPEGAVLVGASDIKASGQIFTDTHGLQDYSQPVALSKKGIEDIINGFVTAAKNAVDAGFDGVEIHGANGYLPEQFLNPTVNNRKDEYGGNIENRARLILQIVASVTKAIGKEKVGIRLSPFSILGDLANYDAEETHQTYVYIAEALNALRIAYLHIATNPSIPDKTFQSLRKSFSGTIILTNGLTVDTGEEALHNGFADLVGFGRSFLSNPDFVQRIEKEVALNPVDFTTLYTAGATGYTDYPIFEKSLIQNGELK